MPQASAAAVSVTPLSTISMMALCTAALNFDGLAMLLRVHSFQLHPFTRILWRLAMRTDTHGNAFVRIILQSTDSLPAVRPRSRS